MYQSGELQEALGLDAAAQEQPEREPEPEPVAQRPLSIENRL